MKSFAVVVVLVVIGMGAGFLWLACQRDRRDAETLNLVKHSESQKMLGVGSKPSQVPAAPASPAKRTGARIDATPRVTVGGSKVLDAYALMFQAGPSPRPILSVAHDGRTIDGATLLPEDMAVVCKQLDDTAYDRRRTRTAIQWECT